MLYFWVSIELHKRLEVVDSYLFILFFLSFSTCNVTVVEMKLMAKKSQKGQQEIPLALVGKESLLTRVVKPTVSVGRRAGRHKINRFPNPWESGCQQQNDGVGHDEKLHPAHT